MPLRRSLLVFGIAPLVAYLLSLLLLPLSFVVLSFLCSVLCEQGEVHLGKGVVLFGCLVSFEFLCLISVFPALFQLLLNHLGI